MSVWWFRRIVNCLLSSISDSPWLPLFQPCCSLNISSITPAFALTSFSGIFFPQIFTWLAPSRLSVLLKCHFLQRVFPDSLKMDMVSQHSLLFFYGIHQTCLHDSLYWFLSPRLVHQIDQHMYMISFPCITVFEALIPTWNDHNHLFTSLFITCFSLHRA